jgi:hypothetical protein
MKIFDNYTINNGFDSDEQLLYRYSAGLQVYNLSLHPTWDIFCIDLDGDGDHDLCACNDVGFTPTQCRDSTPCETTWPEITADTRPANRKNTCGGNTESLEDEGCSFGTLFPADYDTAGTTHLNNSICPKCHFIDDLINTEQLSTSNHYTASFRLWIACDTGSETVFDGDDMEFIVGAYQQYDCNDCDGCSNFTVYDLETNDSTSGINWNTVTTDISCAANKACDEDHDDNANSSFSAILNSPCRTLDGFSCSIDDDCISNQCNSSSLCEPKLANGLDCVTDISCESSYCNNKSTDFQYACIGDIEDNYFIQHANFSNKTCMNEPQRDNYTNVTLLTCAETSFQEYCNNSLDMNETNNFSLLINPCLEIEYQLNCRCSSSEPSPNCPIDNKFNDVWDDVELLRNNGSWINTGESNCNPPGSSQIDELGTGWFMDMQFCDSSLAWQTANSEGDLVDVCNSYGLTINIDEGSSQMAIGDSFVVHTTTTDFFPDDYMITYFVSNKSNFSKWWLGFGAVEDIFCIGNSSRFPTQCTATDYTTQINLSNVNGTGTSYTDFANNYSLYVGLDIFTDSVTPQEFNVFNFSVKTPACFNDTICFTGNTTGFSNCTQATDIQFNVTTFQKCFNPGTFNAFCSDENDSTPIGSCGAACSNELLDDFETAIDYGGFCGVCDNDVLDLLINETEVDYGGKCGQCDTDADKNSDAAWILTIGKTFPFDTDQCAEGQGVIGFITIISLMIIIIIVVLFLIFILFSFLLTAGIGRQVAIIVINKLRDEFIDKKEKFIKNKDEE